MESIIKTYQDAKDFVDSFINSTSSSFSTFRKEPEDAEAWYASWEDNYIGDFLDNKITKSILRKVADKYYAGQLEEIIGQSTKLDALTYPTVYSIYEECCQKLGFVHFPTLYVTGQLQGINALSIEVKGRRLILLSRMSTILLNEQELKFILGHELGHHQQGNLVCHTVNGLLDTLNNKSEVFGSLIADAIETPMKSWCRQSEFNADRAGFICCEGIDVLESLLSKITEKRFRTSYTSISELFEDHPMLMTRMEKLIEFSRQLS